MGIVEAITAATILVVGLLATFAVLDGSRELVTTSERKEIAAHRAERELERLSAIPFANLALASLPGAPAAGDTEDPRSWVSGSSFDWDRASASNASEALVVDASSPDAATPRQTFTDGATSGTIDTFVTTVATGLKRITVAVRLDGDRPPRRATIAATFTSDQSAVAP